MLSRLVGPALRRLLRLPLLASIAAAAARSARRGVSPRQMGQRAGGHLGCTNGCALEQLDERRQPARLKRDGIAVGGEQGDVGECGGRMLGSGRRAGACETYERGHAASVGDGVGVGAGQSRHNHRRKLLRALVVGSEHLHERLHPP